MTSFDHIFQLLSQNGSVAHKYLAELEQLWGQYSSDQQREIYTNIRRKLESGKFVHFNPLIAIRENVPRNRAPDTLSYNEYYERYRTTQEQDGWKRVFDEEKQKFMYVKTISN